MFPVLLLFISGAVRKCLSGSGWIALEDSFSRSFFGSASGILDPGRIPEESLKCPGFLRNPQRTAKNLQESIESIESSSPSNKISEHHQRISKNLKESQRIPRIPRKSLEIFKNPSKRSKNLIESPRIPTKSSNYPSRIPENPQKSSRIPKNPTKSPAKL